MSFLYKYRYSPDFIIDIITKDNSLKKFKKLNKRFSLKKYEMKFINLEVLTSLIKTLNLLKKKRLYKIEDVSLRNFEKLKEDNNKFKTENIFLYKYKLLLINKYKSKV